MCMMRSFLIDESSMGRVPTEQELNDIKKARRSAQWMWVILTVVCLGTVAFTGYLVACFVAGKVSWLRLFATVICLVALVAAGVCLALYYTSLWLWMNRDAGRNIIYPSTMSPMLMEFFDDASKIPQMSGIATVLFSIAVACALLAAGR